MPSPQSKIIDAYTGHAVDLSRVEVSTVKKILPFLNELQTDLIAKIAKIDPTSSKTAATRRKRLENLLKQSTDTIRSAYDKIDQTLTPILIDVGDFEQTFALGTLDASIGVDLASTALTPTQINTLVSDMLIQGAPSAEWWSRQSDSVVAKFADQMRLGFAEGEGITQLVRRVRGYPIGTGGIIAATRRQAEALARTSIQTIAGEVRQSVIEENGDLIKGYIQNSTLDGRTTLICIARDNLKWDRDKQPVGHNLPYRNTPLHWGCRSTIIPWLKSFEELGSKLQVKIPEGTRASMDGQVPESKDYQDWLSGKSEDFQKAVLGESRYKMFKSGKLDLRHLINQNDRPLTVAELRARGY